MTSPTSETPAVDGAEKNSTPRPTTAARWVRPQRRMRYADRARGIPVPDRDTTGVASSDPHGADALAAADDLSDLTPDDYRTAAQDLAQQATEADDGATEDDNDTDDSDGAGEPADFADAFSPVPKDEPADRDDRYRARLRDSENEVERLRSTIEAIQRAEVERLASARLADASDLFRGDNAAPLADLVSDDGRVDPARVDSAVDGVLAAHPHWRAPLTPYSGPLRSGATSVKFEQPSKSFVDAFAPPRAE